MSRALLAASLLVACASSSSPLPDATTSSDVAVDPLDATLDVSDASDVTRDRRDARTPSPRCVNGVALPYPEGASEPTELLTVDDLSFETPAGRVSLHDWYAPCAEVPKILVIRTLASWSGRSQHAASHTRRVLTHPQRDRVALLDLVALGPDNTPATIADLAAWRHRYDEAPDALAIDPDYVFRSLYGDSGNLPLYAIVDTRTMRIVAVLERPSSAAVTSAISRALDTIDGLPRQSFPTVTLVDGRFTRDEWEMIQAMSPPGAPPPDPTNRYADDPRAARFGETLFNDTGLSSNNRVSCATCHASANLFTDGRPRGVGVATGDRNTPTTLFAPHARWLFLDGRVDTLWAQAIGPIENPIEMQFTRVAAVRRVAERYGAEYTAIFGALPDLSNTARFPMSGMPGQPSWEAMSAEDKDTINRVYVNLGKAVAAYERTLRFPATAFDRYVGGDMSALSETQRDGLHHFVVNGCVQCHHGPTLSDDSFHNIGMPTGRSDRMPDRGRIDAVPTLLGSPFRSDGPFSDDRTRGAHIARIFEDESLIGRFHTPSLRGVSHTGPWGHGGTFTTLAAVVRHYALGLQFPPVTGTTGVRDIHLPWFVGTDSLVTPMVELLNAL